jgi:hypothetical protein
VTHPDAEEAARWVAAEVERLRGLTYEDLVGLEGQREHRAMDTAAGKGLVLETQVYWDDQRERRNLRVIVDVWDAGQRVSVGSIAKDDFIVAPDGSFVGE